jgi:hypothetical protein
MEEAGKSALWCIFRRDLLYFWPLSQAGHPATKNPRLSGGAWGSKAAWESNLFTTQADTPPCACVRAEAHLYGAAPYAQEPASANERPVVP